MDDPKDDPIEPEPKPDKDSEQQQQQKQPQSQQQKPLAPQQQPQQDNQPQTSSQQQQQTQVPEELRSNERWGTTPVRQDVPWELPPSPTQQQQTSIGGGGGGTTSGASTAGASHLSMMGSNAAAAAPASRFDQPWRAPLSHHNLIDTPAPGGMQKPPLNTSGAIRNSVGSAMFGGVGMQPNNEFARAPGPASSILDGASMMSKPFGMPQRNSTWSSFGGPPSSNEPDSEWPKTTSSAGISNSGNSAQAQANAFGLVHDFGPGRSWHGSNLMKSLDDDTPINLGGVYGFSASKSPTGNQYESSGIGTWSPIVRGNRPGSMWDGDGPDGGRSDNGRFDDGTAIWGSTIPAKVPGVEWDKTSDASGTNDKPRSSNMAGNNHSTYRPQQSSSSTSLLMSSNTSPSSQHNRNQQTMNKPSSLSQNFDQMQQQSNALSSQANQPNRGLGLSSTVPSKHQQQLTTMIHQIQLAVQAGHLNPQILNQPLASNTLQLLYQLLQQIRSLHQLQAKFNQPGTNQAAVGVQMTKTKQNILNLQNQIAAQQAMHLKSQQTQAHNISLRQPTMPNLATGLVGGRVGPTLPPGISQSGDSFHGQTMAVNNVNLGGGGGGPGVLGANSGANSRFDQSWRAPLSHHNLIDPAPGVMQKSPLDGGNRNSGGSAMFGGVGMQPNNEFARAPGPASSILDGASMMSKPFGMPQRNSTWSSFGGPPSSNEPDSEWPKSSSSAGMSAGGISSQPQSNAFDLVHEFEPGKPWRGSMLMRSVEEDPTMTPGSMARSLAPQRKTIWSDEIL